MSAHLARARALLNTHRPADAAQAAREGLAQDPRNRQLLHTLSHALAQLEQYDEARSVADDLLSLAPDWPDSHQILSFIELKTKHYSKARQAARAALRLNSNLAAPYVNLASAYAAERKWGRCLREAKEGLAREPNNVSCINLRALAFSQLGCTQEGLSASASALRLAPDNTRTHATAGWVHAAKGDHEAAFRFFTDALRLDPMNLNARQGLVQSLKARNPVYRSLLNYSLWMQRRSRCQRVFISFALFAAMNALIRALDQSPDLEPLGFVVGLLWFSFIILLWTTNDVFNFLLLFNPQARHALTDKQRRRALVFAAAFTLAILLLLALLGAAILHHPSLA